MLTPLHTTPTHHTWMATFWFCRAGYTNRQLRTVTRTLAGNDKRVDNGGVTDLPNHTEEILFGCGSAPHYRVYRYAHHTCLLPAIAAALRYSLRYTAFTRTTPLPATYLLPPLHLPHCPPPRTHLHTPRHTRYARARFTHTRLPLPALPPPRLATYTLPPAAPRLTAHTPFTTRHLTPPPTFFGLVWACHICRYWFACPRTFLPSLFGCIQHYLPTRRCSMPAARGLAALGVRFIPTPFHFCSEPRVTAEAFGLHSWFYALFVLQQFPCWFQLCLCSRHRQRRHTSPAATAVRSTALLVRVLLFPPSFYLFNLTNLPFSCRWTPFSDMSCVPFPWCRFLPAASPTALHP